MKRNKAMERIFEQVAAKNHTTVEDVRKEIQLAMMTSMMNRSPDIQRKWEKYISPEEKPIPEKFIGLCVMSVLEKCKKD